MIYKLVKYLFCILVGILFLNCNLIAQQKFLDLLADNRFGEQLFVRTDDKVKFSNDSLIASKPQQLIKVNGKLYLHIIGTGMLFSVQKAEKGGWAFQRIDSTIYWGHNFYSITFPFEGEIYNYGGYGHWHFNGQLRKYNFKENEWNIHPLERELPFGYRFRNKNVLNIDIEKGIIYIAGVVQGNEAEISNKASEKKAFKNEVWKIIIKTGATQLLGKMPNSLFENTYFIKDIGFSPWGTFLQLNEDVALFDFNENKIYYLKPRTELFKKIPSINECSIFLKDSTLYWEYINQGRVDSIKISKNDFIDSGNPIFEKVQPLSQSSTKFWNWVFVLIGLLVGAMGYHFINHFQQKKKKNDLPIKLSEKEVRLLNALCLNSLANKTTTIDEINIVLGLERKSIDIQKKHRSDTLLDLNQKLSILIKTSEPIIQKTRNNADKRSFEYFIHENQIPEVKKLLNA